MGFVDLFRPKWKHSDAAIRASAVRELGPADSSVLEGIAQHDKDAGVRRIAIRKLENAALLVEIAQSDPDESLREIAGEKATSLLVNAAVAEANAEQSAAALQQLTDQKALAEVAKCAAFKAVREAAVARLTDEKALADVLRNAKEPHVRLEALKRVSDPAVLRGVALGDERKEVAIAAIEALSDREALETVARRAKNKAVRNHARHTLAQLGFSRERLAAGRKHENQWQQLCQQAEILARSTDWEQAAHKLDELQSAWDAIDADPAEELTARFLAAHQLFHQRHAAHREQQAARAQQERELRGLMAQGVTLCEQVEALGDAGTLEQLEQLEAQWSQLEALPEAHRSVIEQRFTKACGQWRARQERRQAQGELRAKLHELCSAAEQLLEAELAGPQVKRRYKALQDEWQALRPPAALQDELGERFARVGKRLAELDQASRQEREQQRIEQQRGFEELCARMERLASTDNLRAAERQLKEAQRELKRYDRLPSREARQELQQRFQAAREQLFKRVQELREADSWKRWSVGPKLEELCVEVEALANEPNLKEVARRLKQAQASWKESGPAPKDKAEELWKRFKQACDVAYARCQEQRAQEQQVREENLRQKEELCQHVEALVDSSEWTKTAEAIKELQARWKKIGPVPRAQSDAIWARFRGACDRFFERRQQYLDEGSDERKENLRQKEELCQHVEALVDSSEWTKTAEAIKELQARWKKIGPVPRAQSDAIWARFRGACDRFFERRQQHLDEERMAHQARKEELCNQLSALLARGAETEPAELSRELLAAHEQWRAIGPVSRVAADELWQRFSQLTAGLVEAFPDAFRGTELDPVANLKRKERLCQRAEELAHSSAAAAPVNAAESMEQMAEQLRTALAANALRDSTTPSRELERETALNEVKRLQLAWRKIGPVPGEVGQALWKRFRSACDQLFESYQPEEAEQPSSEEEGTAENFAKKQSLCEQAEALAASESPAAHQAAIRELRRQWKAIGPVPAAKARRLWNRFRRACNRVMSDAKKQAASEAGVEEPLAEENAESLFDAGWDEALDAGWELLDEERGANPLEQEE